jgi:hypothetical protein
MGKAKVTRKFAAVKRQIAPKDNRNHTKELEKESFAIKRSDVSIFFYSVEICRNENFASHHKLYSHYSQTLGCRSISTTF